MANSFRRKGTRVAAMVGSDGRLRLAPAISLGVHEDGDSRKLLKVLARTGPGTFTELSYGLATIGDYLSDGAHCPGPWQLYWQEIEAEISRRESRPFWLHIRHPRDERQSVCGIPAETITKWETEYPPRGEITCEDCYSGLPDAERPDDYTHTAGDPAIIGTLRRIISEQQHAKVNGVLIDLWSAHVTVRVWDAIKQANRDRLLTLPPIALIQKCVQIYTAAERKGKST